MTQGTESRKKRERFLQFFSILYMDKKMKEDTGVFASYT